MQNQKNTKPKKEINFTVISIMIVIIALVVTAVLRLFTPASEKVVSNDFVINNYDDTQTTYKKVNYTGPDLTPPEKFNIYQAQKNSGAADELASKLIRDYKLEKNESIENYWLGETSSMIKNNYDNNYVFKNASLSEGDENLTIITNEAIAVCKNFYSKYNINVDLIPQEKDIYYLNSALEQKIVDPSESTFLQIPLTYELNGYKVFYENANSYPFFCRVDNLYDLERVVFKDFFQEFNIVKQIPSISIDKAASNIKKGSASIIDATSQIATTLDLNWINEAELYSAAIEYRYDGELKIAYPFYRFQANLTNSAGINIKAEIITPAVATAQE